MQRCYLDVEFIVNRNGNSITQHISKPLNGHSYILLRRPVYVSIFSFYISVWYYVHFVVAIIEPLIHLSVFLKPLC